MKPKKVKEEDTIHIKIEYGEAIESKRTILASEINLLKIIQGLKNYRLDRTEELKMQLQLYLKVKEFNTNINFLKKILPKIKIPTILEKEEPKKVIEEIKPIKEKIEPKDDIEYQLKNIQSKLNSLQ